MNFQFILLMFILLFLPCDFVESHSKEPVSEKRWSIECVYASRYQNHGVSLFSFICNKDSALFYSHGCQQYIELLNGTNQEADFLIKRMEKHFTERNDDPLLNKNILYWEHILFDYSKDKLTLYNSHPMVLLSYEENIPPMSWELIPDSSSTILGYSCKYAVSNFRGRLWKVWYTEDIPLSYGPWKLHGLPGLIMEATVDSLIDFKLTSIKTNQTNTIGKVLKTRNYKYEQVTRKKYLKRRNSPLFLPMIKKKIKVSPNLETE